MPENGPEPRSSLKHKNDELRAPSETINGNIGGFEGMKTPKEALP